MVGVGSNDVDVDRVVGDCDCCHRSKDSQERGSEELELHADDDEALKADEALF